MTTPPPSPAALDPIARLVDAAAELRELEERVRFLVRAARTPGHLYSDGRAHSWAEVGAALGVSRQAAWERYGDPREQRPACHFAADPEHHPRCTGLAILRRGTVPLCEPCDGAASTLRKLPRRRL